MTAQNIDYDAINKIALNRFEHLLEQFIPGGRRVNGEYVARNPRRNDKTAGSFSINIRKGVWKDFADSNVGGSDPISLWAYLFGCDGQASAARMLANHLGVPELAGDNDNTPRSSDPQEWTPIIPVPPGAGNPPDVKWEKDEKTGDWMKHPIVARWAYHDEHGNLAGYAARVRLPDDEHGNPQKDVVPQTYCRGQDGSRKWRVKALPKPRPLYGLHRLIERATAPVIVFEGEKTADAGGLLFGKAVCTTWPGGAQALAYADIERLRGRKVAIWPDNDVPGFIAALRLAERLRGVADKVVVVVPPSWAGDGWDVADEAPAGWDAVDHLRRSSVTPEEFFDAVRDRLPDTDKFDPARLQAGDQHPEPPAPEPAEPEHRQPDDGRDARQPQQPPKPLDIFAEFPAPPVRPEMLPRAIADYAAECSDLIGVEASMIALPALVACAAALHDGVVIQPKRHETGWTESARLWCAIVGAPSVKKSPAIRRATKRMRKIDADLSDQNGREQADYQNQLEQHKEAKKDLRKQGGGNIPTPDRPPVRRMIVEDVTVESLSEVLVDNARGVLCIQDELSGWFGAMDAYNGGKSGSKDRAAWLQAYNGGFRQVDRVTRGSLRVPNFSVSMIGGIQPDAIRRIAKDMTEDGLMQRFMIVIGRNAPELDRLERMDINRAYADLVDHLHRVQPGGEPVKLSEGAHEVRERLMKYAGELAEYPALPGGLRSHLGKWSGLFARLLLIYHAIECHGAQVHPGTRLVTRACAEQVELLMRGFLLPHALAYYTDILGASSELEHARWIASYALSRGMSEIQNRDLMQAYKQWRGMDDWRRQRVMQLLEDMGWCSPISTEGSSRRTAHAWAINPVVHELFAERAAEEAERRGRLREEIAAMQRRVRE